MAAVNPAARFVIGGQTALLLALYLFLYFPIFYIGYLSLMENSVWPFPPVFTGEWYARLMIMSDFHAGLLNSVLIGVGTASLSTLFATTAAIGVLRYPVRRRGSIVVLFLAPLFVAPDTDRHLDPDVQPQRARHPRQHRVGDRGQHGIQRVLRVSRDPGAARALRLAFRRGRPGVRRAAAALLSRSDLSQHMAGRARRLHHQLHSRFNNFEITFYNVAAIPTLPTIAWGTLRHGIEPELYALATIVNALVFALLLIIFLLIRVGALRLGVPDD